MGANGETFKEGGKNGQICLKCHGCFNLQGETALVGQSSARRRNYTLAFRRLEMEDKQKRKLDVYKDTNYTVQLCENFTLTQHPSTTNISIRYISNILARTLVQSNWFTKRLQMLKISGQQTAKKKR